MTKEHQRGDTITCQARGSSTARKGNSPQKCLLNMPNVRRGWSRKTSTYLFTWKTCGRGADRALVDVFHNLGIEAPLIRRSTITH